METIQSSNCSNKGALIPVWLRLMTGVPLLLAFILPPPQGNSIAGLPSLCSFHQVTGLPCPGCGLTRAVVCCAHGLWSEALFFHPLGPLAFAIIIGLPAVSIVNILWPGRLAAPSSRVMNSAGWTVALLLLIVWLARMAGALPSPP